MRATCRRDNSPATYRATSLAALAAGLALLLCSALHAADDDEPPLKPGVKERAQRFARIAAWEGYFETTMRGSESSGPWPARSMLFEGSSSGTFRLEAGYGDLKPSEGWLKWSGSGTNTTSAFTERHTWANTQGYDRYTRALGTVPVTGIEFEMQLNDRNVWLSPGLPGTIRIEDRGQSMYEYSHGDARLHLEPMDLGKTREDFAMSWAIPEAASLIDVVETWDGGTLVFTYDNPLGDYLGEGGLRARHRVVLYPVYDDLEVEVTIKGYDQWRPLGSIAHLGQAGNGLTAHAELVRKNAGKGPMPRVKKFRFELMETSREPGVCLNWPLNATDSDFDLKLVGFSGTSPTDQYAAVQKFMSDWGMNSAGDYDAASMPKNLPTFSFAKISANGQKGEVTSPPLSPKGNPIADVAIESYDFGARAELQVICELEDGRQIIGKMKSDGGSGEIVRLPKRALGGWVAESWRQRNNVGNQGDAEDNEKVEGQPHHGDGYTIYEEYRGWVVNGKHVEGNPEKKELFVNNLIGAPARPGLALFERGSGLRVIDRMLPAEWPASRTMNANRRDGPHHVDQHGVTMITISGQGSSGGRTRGVVNATRANAWRPKDVAVITVEVSEVYDGIFSEDRSRNRYNLSDRDGSFAYARAVAHELLHSVGVDHHGEREDAREFFFQASSDPSNPTGRARFCTVRPNLSPDNFRTPAMGVPRTMANFSRGTTITLRWEDNGQDIAEELAPKFEAELAAERAYRQAHPPARDPGALATQYPQLGQTADYWREASLHNDVVEGNTEHSMEQWRETDQTIDFWKPITIGQPREADSGNELCLMRYYFANAYPITGQANAYYVIRPGGNRAGRSLCTSPTGTGANAANHAPQPRFGDAAERMGDCLSQVCPNDAIPGRKI